MKRFFTKASILALGIIATACGQAPQTQVEAEYAVQKVQIADVMVENDYSATIRGRQDIDIYPQVSGTISKVAVTEGQKVQRGQTLFIIDQVPYRAALETAEANVQAATAAEANAQLTYDSKKELFANNVVSEYDLRLAENQLASAKAQKAQAKAQEVNARNNLSYTVVKAPANGVVGTIPYRVGALVSQAIQKPLTTVSDNSDMYVYFSMTENQMLNLTRRFGSMDAMLKSIPKLSLRLSDGSLYKHQGYIESVSGVIDSQTGAISLRAVFPNPDRLLHSGGSGNVVLFQEEKGAMIIPCIATYEVQDKVFVFQLVDGKASSKAVVVKPYDGMNYIVAEGLTPEDIIICEGVGMLRDGMPIKAKGEAANSVAQPQNSTDSKPNTEGETQN